MPAKIGSNIPSKQPQILRPFPPFPIHPVFYSFNHSSLPTFFGPFTLDLPTKWGSGHD